MEHTYSVGQHRLQQSLRLTAVALAGIATGLVVGTILSGAAVISTLLGALFLGTLAAASFAVSAKLRRQDPSREAQAITTDHSDRSIR